MYNNEKQSQCHNLYYRVNLREVMVQKDDKVFFVLAFPLVLSVYHDEELPAELMSVTKVNAKE